MFLNFAIIQFAPGGPVEKAIAEIKGINTAASANFSASSAVISHAGGDAPTSGGATSYNGARGLDEDLIKEIEALYGFDKKPSERFFLMLRNYLRFDFGESFFKARPVIELIKEKMPVSISLGIWTTLIIYLISIPLGIKKAVRDGSKFDISSSFIIIIGYAIPSFLFAIMLIILFAGGSFWQIFPLRGLTSDNFAELSIIGKIMDYFWHLALPIFSMVIGGFASLTMLTKNSFLEEINKQYATTAKAKGCSQSRVLYKHIFRNAMLVVIAGFPSALVAIFFTNSLLIEIIFSLDGLGLLGYEATIGRDYPIIFASLYMFTLLGLIIGLISDLTYHLIDPRINFSKQIS